MKECCICGCKTVWSNDFMAEDFGMEEEVGKDTIIQINTCPNCGIDYYDFLGMEDNEEKGNERWESEVQEEGTAK